MTTFVVIFYSIFGIALIWALCEGVKTRRTEAERFAQANAFWLHLNHPDFENEDIQEELEINPETNEKQNQVISVLINLGIKKSQAREAIEKVVDRFGTTLTIEEMIKKSFQI